MSLAGTLEKWMPLRKWIVSVYLLLIVSAAAFCYAVIGKDLLPKTNNGQLQLSLRAPEGTRLEITEALTKDVLTIIDSTVQSPYQHFIRVCGDRTQQFRSKQSVYFQQWHA